MTYRPAEDLELPDKEKDAAAAAAAAATTTERSVSDRESLSDANATADRLDEVKNHEDHRLKEGRALRESA